MFGQLQIRRVAPPPYGPIMDEMSIDWFTNLPNALFVGCIQ